MGGPISDSAVSGKASIVTLEVNVAVDCGKVSAILPLNTLNGALNAAGVSLCASSTANNAATNSTRSSHATSAPAGSSSLADIQLRQADAAVSLKPANTATPNS